MDKYLNWITGAIDDDRRWRVRTHQKLIHRMHRTPFAVKDQNDQPRENDGYDLRWRFIWENDYPIDYAITVPDVPEGQCSVLEMMTALALRADENFTKSSSSSVPTFFWDMVKSMGLLGETDNMYDDENVKHHLYIFNSRTYEPNGHGGLFMFRNTEEDMRNISIWDQLCRWVNKES